MLNCDDDDDDDYVLKFKDASKLLGQIASNIFAQRGANIFDANDLKGLMRR